MSGRKTLEFLISEDGNQVEVIAHNFQGKECEATIKRLELGEVTHAVPKPEYHQQASQTKTLLQGH